MQFDHQWLHDLLGNPDLNPIDVPGSSHEIYIPKVCGLAESLKFTVRFCVPWFWPDSLGLCSAKRFGGGGDIFISPLCNTLNNKFRTLVHETTHALGAVHNDEATDEVTAEATSFEVCRELGLDTSCFAFPYIRQYHNEGGRLSIDEIECYTTEILSYL